MLGLRRQAGMRMRTHVVVYHGVPEGRLYRIPEETFFTERVRGTVVMGRTWFDRWPCFRRLVTVFAHLPSE
jgi:hypothetical protein